MKATQYRSSISTFALVSLFSATGLHCIADEAFFTKAQAIYSDPDTSPMLLGYLVYSSSAEDQMDYRYLVYETKAFYAVGRFVKGDDLIEHAMKVAQQQGVTASGIEQIRSELSSQRAYWMSSLTPPPRVDNTFSGLTSGGNFQTHTGSGINEERTSSPGQASSTRGSGGNSTSRVPQD